MWVIGIRNESENKVFYATPRSAGFDIAANEDTLIFPMKVAAVSTGLYIQKTCLANGTILCQVPPPQSSLAINQQQQTINFLPHEIIPELQIRSRSGLAFKNKVFVLNSPGTVDEDFPNEIKVLLFNASSDIFNIKKGDRIAQGVVSVVLRAAGVNVKTEERTGGFGSTGVTDKA